MEGGNNVVMSMAWSVLVVIIGLFLYNKYLAQRV